MSLLDRSESTATTELHKSNYTFNWRIANFDIICPEQAKEFEMIKSPTFVAGEDIQKKSKWLIHVTGTGEHIACYLQMEPLDSNRRDNRSQSVTCAFKMSFGNSENRFYFTRVISAHKFTKESNDWGYSKFIAISDLYEKREFLLQDNTVHICVQMEIYGEPVNTISTLSFKRKHESTLETFSSDFQTLLKNGKMTDVQISCGGKVFPAHRLILAARSKVFNAMLTGENFQEAKNKEVTIEDMEPDVFGSVLSYIYTGKVTLPSSCSWTELIYGAEKYDLPELKHHCFNQMFENVSNESIGLLAVAAHTYNASDETKTIVKKYCQANIKTLLTIPSFKKLVMTNPNAFFED